MRIITVYCLLFLLLKPLAGHAQIAANDSVAAPYPSAIESLLTSFQPIYDFQKGEVIASIGAYDGEREIIFSMMADSLTFYLQDINPIMLEPEQVAVRAEFWYNQANLTDRNVVFNSVRGREKDTRLPERFFDKILIENSLHEFTYPKEMLLSVARNLKPGGRVFIGEIMVGWRGQRHEGCLKRLYTEKQLLKLLDETGFVCKRIVSVNPDCSEYKVFEVVVK
mgnify:CR=1 FL=1